MAVKQLGAHRRLSFALFFVLLPVVALAIFAFTRSRLLAPIAWDEEQFLWQGWVVMHGGIPYRDFFEPKPPVIFFANAIGLMLFGLNHFLFRLVPTGLALASLTLFAAALLRRKMLPWVALLVTAQLAIWLLGGEFHDSGLNDTESYGFSFSLLGFSLGYVAPTFASRRNKRMVELTSGFCFALAVFSKELFLLAVLPAWVIIGVNIETGAFSWRRLAALATGASACIAAFLIYLIVNSAFLPYVELVKYYRPMAANYCMDIGVFPRVSGMTALAQCWVRLHNEFYNWRHFAFALPLGGLAIVGFGMTPHRLAKALQVSIGAVAVILGMVAIAAGYCFWRHYFLLGQIGIGLLCVAGGETATALLRKQNKVVEAASFIVGCTLLTYVAMPQVMATVREKHTAYNYPWDPLTTRTIEQHSKPGDYILATDSPLIYVVLNRRNPLPLGAFTDEVLPYIGRENPLLGLDALRERLEQHPPKVFYSAGVLRHRQEQFYRVLFDPLFARYGYVKINEHLWYVPTQ